MARVLIIGDTHCPGMRRGYVDFLKRIADRHAVNRIVHIGDLVDWAAISYHEKSPQLLNASAEAKAARRQVQQLAKAFPDVDWLIGNHDALPHRQAESAGLPPELLRSASDFWEIDWVVHPQFTKLEIDGTLLSHGDQDGGGKFAALNQAAANFQSVAIGHFHAQAGVSFMANRNFRVFGMAVSCGIDAPLLQFRYGWKFKQKPILGCGVLIDGKRPIYEPWLLRSR